MKTVSLSGTPQIEISQKHNLTQKVPERTNTKPISENGSATDARTQKESDSS
jgi:hypothetical protein